MTLGTWNTQALVNTAGGACTDWISTGNWVGVNKFTDWNSKGYQLLCQAWLDESVSVDVYSFPYFDDRVVGYQTCLAAENVGARVVYNDVGPAQDFRRF